MQIKIIAVGSKPRGWVAEACTDYVQRLRALGTEAQVSLVSPVDEHKYGAAGALERESAALLEHLPAGSTVVLCDSGGQQLSSTELAELLGESRLHARDLVFVLGGSHGVSAELRQRAGQTLAFGRITLPHELARVVLLEQLYRAESILANRAYHK